MRSHCPECGSSLTIKEAIQNFCSNCSRSFRAIPVHSQRGIDSDSHSLLGKNHDSRIAHERKNKKLLSVD